MEAATMLYFQGTVAFVTFLYIWETYLLIRQRRQYFNPNVPKILSKSISQEVYDKSRSYGLDKSTFTIALQTFSYIETMVVLMMGGLPYAWDLSGSALEHVGISHSDHEIVQSLVFLYLTTLYQTVVHLPWNIYSTFVLEEKHGFNKQTFSFYVKDQIKSLLLTLVITALLMPPLIYIFGRGGAHMYFYAWLFVFVFSLLTVTVYQDYIAPMFDKYELLKDGPLRQMIEKLTSSIGFPLGQLLVVHASMRSNHSNAYFYGFFGNKKIVLFDTLLGPDYCDEKEKPANGNDEKDKPANDCDDKDKAAINTGNKAHSTEKGTACTNEEVVAVLSHELGHWKNSHPLKMFAIGQLNALTLFMCSSLLMNNAAMYRSFGFYSQPIIIGLMLIIGHVFAPLNWIINYFLTKMSRKFEYQADTFAVGLGYGDALSSSLIKLQIGNLGTMRPDPLYSDYHYSHPPLVERLQGIKLLQQNGKKQN